MKISILSLFLVLSSYSLGQTYNQQLDSIKVLKEILSSLKPYDSQGYPSKIFKLEFDECIDEFKILVENHSFGIIREQFNGRISDATEFILNGNETSCNLTIKSKQHKDCFTHSTDEFLLGNDEIAPVGFIYLGEFKISEIHKLVRIQKILEFLEKSSPKKLLTPSFFKQDTIHLNLSAKTIFTWNESLNDYEESLSEPIEGQIVFVDENNILIDGQNYITGAPFKEEETGMIIVETNHPEVDGIGFDIEGTVVIVISALEMITYDTFFDTAPCQ